MDATPTTLRADVIAGLTTAAVVIPKTMAFAAIAGVPLEAGRYTALVRLVIYAVMSTSRPLSVTTTSTTAILPPVPTLRARRWRHSHSTDSACLDHQALG
jgi:MFS superfamily sulfate permease-like transporter